MEHITYIGEVVEKLADHSSFPELFIKYEEGDPIPSGKAIHEIIELCRAVLFPGYYGNHTVNSQTLTFHLGVTLEKLSNILTQQIQAGMLFGNENMKERIKGTPCCQTARKYAERFQQSVFVIRMECGLALIRFVLYSPTKRERKPHRKKEETCKRGRQEGYIMGSNKLPVPFQGQHR